MALVPRPAFAAALLACSGPALAGQQPVPNPLQAALPAPPYADIADLVVAAPVVVDATVRSTLRLKPVDAPDVLPGHARLYVEADIVSLIRGTGSLAARIGYTLDVVLDTRGRPPRLRKLRVLLFARGVPGNAAQVQLIRPDAQRDWTQAAEDLTRRIVRDVLASDAPPVVTGVGNAFHTPGDLPGEGETQVFLTTADGRPVSLGIVRRPDAPPSWTLALGEVVGAGLPPPPRDTLSWYRLACALPAALPDAALHSSDADATIAREDYALVMRSLGPCERGGRLPGG